MPGVQCRTLEKHLLGLGLSSSLTLPGPRHSALEVSHISRFRSKASEPMGEASKSSHLSAFLWPISQMANVFQTTNRFPHPGPLSLMLSLSHRGSRIRKEVWKREAGLGRDSVTLVVIKPRVCAVC